MVEVTLTDGTKMQIEGERVVRIRRTGPIESPHGVTRIDWKIVSYVMEEPGEVADLVRDELSNPATLAKLDTPGLGPVWFSGPKSQGPIPVPKEWQTDGVVSSLYIGNSLQYVGNSPEVVYDVLEKAGGDLVPIKSHKTHFWDAEV
ncbi:hypothetical protein [Rhizobium mesosinicum]|uniref:Uncharacterized protein n=1 Tax=Rhizobium mesosinicum TaxID=335017 RepID=A0ABS7GU13_9HYPH|nr:hypothetical protein [Rhizobium mesosinicum]MBW9053448.1 hypothetical protein [Rhizobium mesosinicum]